MDRTSNSSGSTKNNKIRSGIIIENELRDDIAVDEKKFTGNGDEPENSKVLLMPGCFIKPDG